MERREHPQKSEALRPKVVEALKEVRMRKVMTKNDNEKQEEERRQSEKTNMTGTRTEG